MFEGNNNNVEELMSNDANFRRLFNKHQELDRRVRDAEIGAQPIEDLALVQLKKEKLWAKDQLTKIMDVHATVI